MEADAFSKAISAARRVFDAAEELGLQLEILDIGGGFPGQERSEVSLGEISANIKSIAVPNAWAVDHDFSGAVKKIGEVSDLGADGKNVIEVLSEICVMAKCN